MQKTIILVYKKIFDWVRNNIILVVFLLLGSLLSFQPVEYNPRVIFLDVGQGDAIMLVDSSGKKFLIDGGGGDYVVYSLGKYLHPRDRLIDTLILTHPHEDHLSGLIDILERYQVKKIFHYPTCYNSSLYSYFLSLNANIKAIEQDFVFVGESFSLKLLYPTQEVEGECMAFSNVNNASIVIKLESQFGSILLMGDAEHEVENILMKEDVKSDILKAGHHCSKTASSKEFLKMVQPAYAICSVGLENKFGHPHAEVLENFNQLGIKYDLTSEVGDIVVELY